jgi:predicted permease
MLNGIWRDLILAVRSLGRARAFSLVCTLSLGVGMVPVLAVPYGARIFDTPPVGLETETLVEVITSTEESRQATNKWSYPDYLALRDAGVGATSFGWAGNNTEVRLAPSQGGRMTATTLFVSTNYFPTLGLPLALGQGFRDSTDPQVIVSFNFWKRTLGGQPDTIGSILTINNTAYTVVGVAPELFGGHLGLHDAELFLPLERHPLVVDDDGIRFDRAREWVNVHGRLTPGSTLGQAHASVRAVTMELAKEHAATNANKFGVVEPYFPPGALEWREIRVIRSIIQALATLPLLVVCLNIAGMVQVRSAIRERELSIRQAIGATRGLLMRQLLAESLVLAAAGVAIASVILFNIAPLVAWWQGQPLPPRFAAAFRVDATMLAIVAGLCLVTTLVFGWLPASRFSRPVIITALKDEAGGGGVRVGRFQRVAVALQIGIATPLLILSAMTLDRVRATAVNDLGFEAEHLHYGPLTVRGVDANTAAARVEGARQALAAMPGVAAVTIADGLPLDFRYRITRAATQPGSESAPLSASVHVTRVGQDYFATMGIPVIRGRTFDSGDQVGSEPVTIIAKPLAERLFPDDEPVGKRITFAAGEKIERTLTIVGVSADFPTSQMSTNRAQLLLPLAQYPDVLKDSVWVNDDLGGSAHLQLILRRAPGESAAGMASALEATLRDLDSEFDAASITSGAVLREKSVRDFLTQAGVAGVVGGVLLMLAALGIYGVVGLMVATRVREIAIRVALGASRRQVVSLVLFDVLKLIAPGIGIGVLLAVAFVKLNGEDFGIALSALEPLAYVIGAAIAIIIAIVASVAPARRAASVEPMVAMRSL